MKWKDKEKIMTAMEYVFGAIILENKEILA